MRIRGVEGQDWEAVLSVNRRWEADLASSYLEANGVRTRVLTDDLGGQRPDVAFTWGVHVLVPTPEAEAARALLDEAERASAEED